MLSLAILFRFVVRLLSTVIFRSLKAMLNSAWTTTEQQFLHQRIMRDAKKLSKEELLKYFEIMHNQYQIRSNLFSRLLVWCASNNVILPPLDELLVPKDVDHPIDDR